MKAITPERLFWLAAFAALASVALAAAPIIRRLGQDLAPSPAPATERRVEEPPISLEPILALAPFGSADAPAEEAEETALDLTLHGVVIAAAPAGSRAIVSGGETPPQAYAPGERIAGVAALVAVERDRIVLEVEGRRETLPFAEPAASGPQAAAPRLPVPAASPAPASTAPADPGPSDTALALAAMRESFRDNPYRVLEDLGIAATQAGYRIGASPAEAVRRAGLQPGDIVERINGHPVGNVELDRRFLDAVATTGQARVEVVRGTERLVMSFPLQ